MLAKKLLKLLAVREGYEQAPVLSFILLKSCSDFFLELICLITDQVFLRSELTDSSLSWKYFFLATLKRKLYLFRYLLYLALLDSVGFFLELFIKRILLVTKYKETFWKPGFRRTPGFRVYRFKWKWFMISRNEKTREYVIGDIHGRIRLIDNRQVDGFQFRLECCNCWRVNEACWSLSA